MHSSFWMADSCGNGESLQMRLTGWLLAARQWPGRVVGLIFICVCVFVMYELVGVGGRKIATYEEVMTN